MTSDRQLPERVAKASAAVFVIAASYSSFSCDFWYSASISPFCVPFVRSCCAMSSCT